MPVVVVGGNGKDVGKTSLICGLIRALPEYQWVAAKVTTHEYGAAGGVAEEHEAGPQSDTSRFMAAGAKRAFLISAGEDELASAVGELREGVGAGAALIFESNRVAEFVDADVCLAVVEDGREEKPSFTLFLQRADATVVRGGSDGAILDGCPQFALRDLEHPSPEMAEWMRGKLQTGGASSL